MGTELQQQKFLTLECDGRSRISCTSPTRRRRRAPGYFLNFLTLLPAREGKAAENTYYGRPSSYGVCRDKEARDTTWCGGTDPAWRASGWGGSERSGWGWGTPCGGHGQSSAPGTVPPVRAVGSRVGAVPLRSPRKLDVSMRAAGAHGIWGKRGAQPQRTLSGGGGEGAGALGRVT